MIYLRSFNICSQKEQIKVQKNNKMNKITNTSYAHKDNHNDEQNMCRICLEYSLRDQMINPCKCSGSMKNVHEKCLQKWIKHKVGKVSKSELNCLLSNGMQCEICGKYIKFTIEWKYKCQECSDLTRNIFNNTLTFVLYSLFLILLLLALMTSCYYCAQLSSKLHQTFFIILILIQGFFMAIYCYKFVTKIFLLSFFDVSILNLIVVHNKVDEEKSMQKINCQ